MLSKRLLTGMLWLLVLGTGTAAQAQSTATSTQDQATVVAPASAGPAASSQAARYSAAHDSLMQKVRTVRAQVEDRLVFFKSTKGSFNGLHRRVKGYSAALKAKSEYNYATESSSSAGLVKEQVVKTRFGIELEKVNYYDYKDRKVLSERYENHQLTRLELVEYDPTGIAVSEWLLVRGGYLKHTAKPIQATASKRIMYFFNTLPVAQ